MPSIKVWCPVRACKCRARAESARRYLLSGASESSRPSASAPGIPSVAERAEHQWPLAARAAVREHSHYGVDWIKIYETEDYEGSGYPQPSGAGAFMPDGKMINVPSLTLEENQAIVDEAHRRGLKVACHAYGGEGLRNCLRPAWICRCT